MDTQHPYERLSQDRLIDWLENIGLYTDYRIYPLNSYENRVYRVGVEDDSPVVIKVYRPNRWSKAQIQEELDFTDQLAEAEIPVVPAQQINGVNLHEQDGFLFASFPMRAGHAFELDNADQLYRVGQLLGRLHSVGKQSSFKTRPVMSLLGPIQEARAFFQDSDMMSADIKHNYLDCLTGIENQLPYFQRIFDQSEQFRIHGDFHPGNILTRDDQLLVVDFDDTVTGPAMQDIWKLLSGSAHEQAQQLNELEEGYEQFCEFPRKEIPLAEALRTVHMVKHALWIAKRWQDPAFPVAFSWFGTDRYWSEHLMALREQWAELQDKSSEQN